ncbi:MAG: hypothetical protein ACLS37_11370, partial [Alistipes sp.]
IESPAPALDRLLTICLAISASVLLLSLSERAARIKGVNVAAGFIAYSSLVAYMFHRQLMMVFIHFYWPGSSNGRLIYVLLFCAPAVILRICGPENIRPDSELPPRPRAAPFAGNTLRDRPTGLKPRVRRQRTRTFDASASAVANPTGESVFRPHGKLRPLYLTSGSCPQHSS